MEGLDPGIGTGEKVVNLECTVKVIRGIRHPGTARYPQHIRPP